MAYTSNATELVYNLICEKIKNLEWQEGDKIWTEQRFCNELGVSRVAVRQAIDKLVATNTLHKIQGSGTYVQESNPVALINVPTHIITDENLLAIINFRIYFETGNVEQFLKYATPDQYESLEKVHDLLMKCDSNSEDFFKLDYEFHRIIAIGTQNIFVEQIYELLADTLIKNQERLYNIIGPDVALEYHPLIMTYIRKKDAEIAALMMKRHMEATSVLFTKYMTQKRELENGFY